MEKDSLLIMENVILEMGGTIEDFIPERNCFCINVLGKQILLKRNISISRQSFVSAKLTTCKDITHKLLLANKLPSPMARYFYYKSFDKRVARKKLDKLSYPIILKQSAGSNSRGIFPNIKMLRRRLK